MVTAYEAHGVKFQFPDDWELSEHEEAGEVFVTASSNETSFWSLNLFFDRPDPQHVVESALEAFRSEYPDLDSYPVDATLCGVEAIAQDIEFLCLELTNSAFLRSIRTDRFTALVLFQATDHELETTRETLEAISASLECDGSPEDIPGFSFG